MMTKSFRTLTLGSVLCATAVGLALTLSGCTIGTGPGNGYGYGCQSDLFVDWQIQNLKGGSVTCDAAGAATVVIDIDGTKYPQTCDAGQTTGNQDILLQANYATYDVTVSLEDGGGYPLATPQVVSVNVTSCGSYATPGPAILVVTPSAQ